MTPTVMNESTVEEAVLSILEELGYGILHEPEIAPGEARAKQTRYDEVVTVMAFEIPAA